MMTFKIASIHLTASTLVLTDVILSVSLAVKPLWVPLGSSSFILSNLDEYWTFKATPTKCSLPCDSKYNLLPSISMLSDSAKDISLLPRYVPMFLLTSRYNLGVWLSWITVHI